MKKFFADFKKFITRGNIVDMAIGVIVGNAFSAIVKAFTDKVIMPLINLLLSLGGDKGLESAYTFLKVAYDEDGAIDLTKSIYIDWGAFVSSIINFLLVAFTLFIIVRTINNVAKAREIAKLELQEEVNEKKAIRKIAKEQKVSKKQAKKIYEEKVEAAKVAKAEEERIAAEQAAEAARLAEEKAMANTRLLEEIRDLLKNRA